MRCGSCPLRIRHAGRRVCSILTSPQLHRVAGWVTRLRADIHAAILDGQADNSIRAGADAEPTAHAIVVEGIGSAFMWIVDPHRRLSRPNHAMAPTHPQDTHDLKAHPRTCTDIDQFASRADDTTPVVAQPQENRDGRN
jgi:hypothetical protein